MSRNIAIDGPSGSGKSTLARAIAAALNIHYLDTGSMYRAAAYAALQNGVDIENEAAVEAFCSTLRLQTVYSDGQQQNLYRGIDTMPFVRTPEMSSAASRISAYPCIRHKLVAMQREVAKQYDVVLDGRDIGTFVLPDADFKFFITADVTERARRRYIELLARGIEKPYRQVLADIEVRDRNDSSRSLAPLRQASDAILIDTTHLTISQAAEQILRRIKQE